MKKQVFYKYKSLDNFEFLLDVVLRERLYAAQYHELNDPMEGIIKVDGAVSIETRESWEEQIKRQRIVCFTKNPDNSLMWSHYADGDRGCVIGFELIDDQPHHKVSYLKKPILTEKDLFLESAKDILRHKERHWKYEEEYRCLVESQRFLPVKIRSIMFGSRAEESKVDMLTHILDLCSPHIDLLFRGKHRIFKGPETITLSKRLRLVGEDFSLVLCRECTERKLVQDNYIAKYRGRNHSAINP